LKINGCQVFGLALKQKCLHFVIKKLFSQRRKARKGIFKLNLASLRLARDLFASGSSGLGNWDLRFIWNLELGIWGLTIFREQLLFESKNLGCVNI
jgi:hypothetical protein